MIKGLMFQQQQQQQQQVIVEENMSNLTSASGEASGSSGNRTEIGTNYPPQQYFASSLPSQSQTQPAAKKKRNLPGNPDPDAEVIALSPKSLLATNRFICEICNKGFQRDQNLQLHRRGHNLPWKLKQRSNKEVIRKKVYVCPEVTCVHHDPARALGDLTGIKKHFCRKHGEKKWKCEKCSKRYAVQSDWKAHSKTCGTREYRCDCGTLFSRRDSFITHRAFCDALAEESARANPLVGVVGVGTVASQLPPPPTSSSSSSLASHILNLQDHHHHHLQNNAFQLKKENQNFSVIRPEIPPWLAYSGSGPPASSIFSTRLDQDFSQTPHRHDHQQDVNNNNMNMSQLLHHHHHHHHHNETNPNQNQNENPNPSHSHSVGPTLPPPAYPSAHMSATALLQKAAQMGATITKTGSSSMIRTHHHTHVPTDPSNASSVSANFGLNLSSTSRESAILIPPPPNSASSATTASNSNNNNTSSSSFLLHDVMNMTSFSTASGFEGTSFEDAFGGILNPKTSIAGAADDGGGNGGGGEGLTRDFLGLRPLSHSDILSIAGIGNCMNPSSASSSHDQQNNQSQKPWQG